MNKYYIRDFQLTDILEEFDRGDKNLFKNNFYTFSQNFYVYFFGGLECVGHSFDYVAHLWFLRDVWIRTQSMAVASWRATDLATHPSRLSHPSL